MRLRSAAESDAPALQAVSEAAWEAGHADVLEAGAVEAFLAEYYGVEQFRRRASADDQWLRVAEAADGTLVGFALVQPVGDAASTYGLARLYVRPERWGEGVGTRLLADAERLASERGGTRLRLGVLAANDRAVGFYESRGYERIGEGHDELLDAPTYTYATDLD